MGMPDVVFSPDPNPDSLTQHPNPDTGSGKPDPAGYPEPENRNSKSQIDNYV